MFNKIHTQPGYFTPHIDTTDPNQYRNFLKERYVEKKIIAYIENTELTESDHHILYGLTQLVLDNYALIYKNIWSQISNNFDKFKKQQLSLLTELNIASSKSELIYKTVNNTLINLPNNRLEIPGKLVKQELLNCALQKGYFDDFDLQALKVKNLEKIKQFGPKYRFLTAAERQQEQDESSTAQVGYWDTQEDSRLYNEAKHFASNMNEIENIIRFVRSLKESNNFDDQKFDKELYNELLIKEKINFGFELMNKPQNTLSKEEIKLNLNQTLLSETNLEKIEKLVLNGADINAVGAHGMTILGVFLSEPRNKNLNKAVPKLMELGIDVNLGLNKTSKKNNLIIAMERYKPEISNETINMLIEKSSLEDINYCQSSGSVVHYAIYRPNRYSCLEKLVNMGASLQGRTSAGLLL